MKNFVKHLTKQVAERKKSAGGDKMRVHAVSDPRFSRVKSDEMFNKGKQDEEEPEDEVEEAKEDVKETYNPNKKVKRLKKMPNPGKKKK